MHRELLTHAAAAIAGADAWIMQQLVAVTPTPSYRSPSLSLTQNKWFCCFLDFIPLIVSYHPCPLPPLLWKWHPVFFCKHLSECWIWSTPMSCQAGDIYCCTSIRCLPPSWLRVLLSIVLNFTPISKHFLWEPEQHTLSFSFIFKSAQCIKQAWAVRCQAYHLIHPWPVHQLSVFPTTCCSAPRHFSTALWKHPASLPAHASLCFQNNLI